MPGTKRVSLLLLLALATPVYADDSPVIVRGQGVSVTVADVERTLAQQSPELRARYRDPKALRQLVNELVRQQLLANEAAKRGYERDRAVVQNVKDGAAQSLVHGEVDLANAPESVPESDLKAYYDAHPGEFHRPPLRRAAVIVFDREEDAARVLPEASKADPRAYAELARQHSREPKSKVQGGDLGYFTREAPATQEAQQPPIPDSVRAAAFALPEIGATSPAAVPYGQQFAIVRVSGLRPERDISFDAAAPSIRAKLWRERRQKALDALLSELRTRHKPQLFTDRIYAIDFEDMERRPNGFAPDPVAAPAPGTPAKAER